MDKSINCFPGYEMVVSRNAKGEQEVHNMYRGTDLGLGGYVYFDPGIYYNVALIDAASLHPASIINLNKLGKYTQRYADLREARVLIKHHDYEAAGKLFDGKLKKYLESDEEADALSKALKLPLNSFFGISFSKEYVTAARDSRDINNIIALRGALFMRTLQDEVEDRGFHIVHIKTDSCKIPNATPEIIEFVQEFGRKYGYEMEHEATYDRMCLVNGSTYIAKYDDKGIRNKGGKHANEWTATAAQFQVPYVFKTLFSHEPIIFKDLCEVKSVKTAIYLDFNEDLENVEDIEDAITKWNKSCKKQQVLHEEKKSLMISWANNNNDPEIGAQIEVKQKEEAKEERVVEKQRLYLQERLNTDLDWGPLLTYAEEYVERNHNRQFIGGVGQFCPMKPGTGGGLLVRTDNIGGFSSVTGTKGYRWMESEVVKATGREGDIDEGYYRVLVDEAVAAISEYGNFDEFVS